MRTRRCTSQRAERGAFSSCRTTQGTSEKSRPGIVCCLDDTSIGTDRFTGTTAVTYDATRERIKVTCQTGPWKTPTLCPRRDYMRSPDRGRTNERRSRGRHVVRTTWPASGARRAILSHVPAFPGIGDLRNSTFRSKYNVQQLRRRFLTTVERADGQLLLIIMQVPDQVHNTSWVILLFRVNVANVIAPVVGVVRKIITHETYREKREKINGATNSFNFRPRRWETL